MTKITKNNDVLWLKQNFKIGDQWQKLKSVINLSGFYLFLYFVLVEH